jgi:hypothetical protein
VANTVPTKPTIIEQCPVPVTEAAGYYTEQQSHTNVARKDKFMLVLDVPCGIKPLLKKENRFCNGGSLDRLQFSVWGYVVPEISVPKQEYGYGGEVFQYSSNSKPAYDAVNVNFTVDNRFDNYFILWKWLELQRNNETPCYSTMPDYMTTITVYAMDEYNNPVAQWNYTNAFISSLGSLEPAARDTAELESTFSFNFSQLEMRLL